MRGDDRTLEPTLEEIRLPIGNIAYRHIIPEYELADWPSARGWIDRAPFARGPEGDVFDMRLVASLSAAFVKGSPVKRPAVLMPANWWEHLKLDLGALFERLGLRAPRVRSVVLREAETFYTRACPHLARRNRADRDHLSWVIDRGD